jgi:hypothetical protein
VTGYSGGRRAATSPARPVNCNNPVHPVNIGAAMSNNNGLSGRQALFVAEYLKSGDAAGAYAAAGYRTTSANSTRAAASRLLTRHNISAAINAGQKSITDEVVHAASVARLCTVAEVVLGLRREANRTGRGSSHSARVAALGKLAELLGLNKQPDRDDFPLVRTVTIVLHKNAEDRP